MYDATQEHQEHHNDLGHKHIGRIFYFNPLSIGVNHTELFACLYHHHTAGCWAWWALCWTWVVGSGSGSGWSFFV